MDRFASNQDQNDQRFNLRVEYISPAVTLSLLSLQI